IDEGKLFLHRPTVRHCAPKFLSCTRPATALITNADRLWCVARALGAHLFVRSLVKIWKPYQSGCSGNIFRGIASGVAHCRYHIHHWVYHDTEELGSTRTCPGLCVHFADHGS
ncbi:unnamed protein product, partial [Pylaiella littoralis]